MPITCKHPCKPSAAYPLHIRRSLTTSGRPPLHNSSRLIMTHVHSFDKHNFLHKYAQLLYDAFRYRMHSPRHWTMPYWENSLSMTHPLLMYRRSSLIMTHPHFFSISVPFFHASPRTPAGRSRGSVLLHTVQSIQKTVSIFLGIFPEESPRAATSPITYTVRTYHIPPTSTRDTVKP